MPKFAVIFGLLLIALGLYGYLGGDLDHRSPTALIPAFVGAPILLCGVVALAGKAKKTCMHIAAGLSLLGALASGGRAATKLDVLFSSDPDVDKRAVTMVAVMFLLCLGYLGLSVQSFIAARKRQAASD